MKIAELPTISPQLAVFVPKEKWTARWNITYTFEPKYDGYCAMLYWTREQGVKFYSREYIEHPHIYSFIKRDLHEYFSATKYDAVVIHGELIAQTPECPTGDLNALQNRNNTRVRIKFIAFDFPYSVLSSKEIQDNRELAWTARRKRLRFLLKNENKYLKLVPSKLKVEELPNYANLEGHVAKDTAAPYYEKRHSSWIKLKERQGSDFIVTGYREGVGTTADTFGSLELAEFRDNKLYSVGCVGTGFTFAQRETIWRWIQENCIPEWKHFIAEVAYPRRTTSGVLWHAALIRIRFPGE